MKPFLIHSTLTVVSCHLLPSATAVSTQSKRAHRCNSHFIHCTKIEVDDGVQGCTRARHWASGVRGGSPSPVLHRVTSDHLTRSNCWSAPGDSDLARFIQCDHWHTTISGLRYICLGVQWSKDRRLDKQMSTAWAAMFLVVQYLKRGCCCCTRTNSLAVLVNYKLDRKRTSHVMQKWSPIYNLSHVQKYFLAHFTHSCML